MQEDEYLEFASYVHDFAKDKHITNKVKCYFDDCGDKRVGHLIHFEH
jgi:hypothetical protein